MSDAYYDEYTARAAAADSGGLAAAPVGTPTWDELATAAPRLRLTEAIARDWAARQRRRRRPAWCAGLAWARLKPDAEATVGFDRAVGPEWAQTSTAFDVAARHLLAILPPCGPRCGCIKAGAVA